MQYSWNKRNQATTKLFWIDSLTWKKTFDRYTFTNRFEVRLIRLNPLKFDFHSRYKIRDARKAKSRTIKIINLFAGQAQSLAFDMWQSNFHKFAQYDAVQLVQFRCRQLIQNGFQHELIEIHVIVFDAMIHQSVYLEDVKIVSAIAHFFQMIQESRNVIILIDENFSYDEIGLFIGEFT